MSDGKEIGIGDTVVLAGVEDHPWRKRYSSRKGVAVKVSDTMIAVRWDGNKSYTKYHKSSIQKA